MNLQLTTYKNYKELCNVMDWKTTGGKSKQLQLKDLERFCKYHKEGNKFIIDEVFENPLLKEENKRNSGNLKTYTQLNISENEYINKGIYYIIKNNSIYIGSTVRNFRERFQEHYRGNDESMQHTYNMINNGGVFNILFDMTNIEDEELIRMVENEYIKYFIDETDYCVINQINGWNLFKKKYKSIKIEKEYFDMVLNLLKTNDLSGHLHIN